MSMCAMGHGLHSAFGREVPVLSAHGMAINGHGQCSATPKKIQKKHPFAWDGIWKKPYIYWIRTLPH